MRRKHFTSVILSAALVFIILGCGAQSVKQETPYTLPGPIESSKKPDWEVQYEKTLAMARKEKKVVIATGHGSLVRDTIMKGFKNSHNLDIEFIVGTGQELSNKITAQRRAGIFDIDIIVTGLTTIVQVLKPQGYFEFLLPQLLLPDVVDIRNWYENKIQFVDKEGKVIFVVLSPAPNVFANSNLIRKDEISSYRDLLNPRWQGKMAMSDPTVPGTGQEFTFVTMKSYGAEFLRDLARQNPMIIRNDRMLVEWIAQGKYPIGISGTSIAIEFEKDGAPIFFPTMKEEKVTVGPGFGGIALFKNAPHPNASTIFINWLFSREGQLLYSKSYERQSVRVDVPFDHLPSLNIREPGKSYIKSSDEENLVTRDANLATAREVFGPLVK